MLGGFKSVGNMQSTLWYWVYAKADPMAQLTAFIRKDTNPVIFGGAIKVAGDDVFVVPGWGAKGRTLGDPQKITGMERNGDHVMSPIFWGWGYGIPSVHGHEHGS